MAKFRIVKNRKAHLRRRRLRRVLTLFIIVGVFAYMAHTTYANRMLLLEEAQAELTSYQEKYDEVLLRQGFYLNQIIRLEDEEYVTMFARERYFFSLPNEIIFRVIAPSRVPDTVDEYDEN